MPRPRPPYLNRETNRHGKTVWYFRKYPGPRIRIHGEYGTPEFTNNYEKALSGNFNLGKTQSNKQPPETLAWLIARYKESIAWANLANATKSQRTNIFKHVVQSAGTLAYASISRADIAAGRDKRSATPAAATNFIKTMRALFSFAVDAGYIQTDPTQGVKRPNYKTDGHHVWSEAEVNQFEIRWPIGTRERLAMAILLYTGLRRGDAVRLGKQHIRNGIIQIRTEKTGTEAFIPVYPPLQEILAVSPTGDLTFIAGKNGCGLTKESFGNWFRDACKAAGVPGSAHGLRKAGATRAAEQGATENELEAIFGWNGGRMAAHYTKTANRERLARNAAMKLGNKSGTSIPSPKSFNPAPKNKAN